MKCHFGTSILRLYLLLRCIHTLHQSVSIPYYLPNSPFPFLQMQVLTNTILLMSNG